MDRTASGRDRLATVLVAMLAYYVPLVAVSLCNVDMPELVMALLYAAPLAVLLLGALALGLRAVASIGHHPVPVPVPAGG